MKNGVKEQRRELKKVKLKDLDISKFFLLSLGEIIKQVEIKVRDKNTGKSFKCRMCKTKYSPLPEEWIFHKLCSGCFFKFDKQKMEGRMRITKGEVLKYHEDSKRWVREEKKK